MKTVFLIIASCLFLSGTTFSQDSNANSRLAKSQTKYCISVVGGKTIVTQDGKLISRTVPVGKGAQITPGGKVIWRDKSEFVLQEGQCIDKDGMIYTDINFLTAKNNKGTVRLLPEVTVTDDKHVKSSENNIEQADEFTRNAFQEYVTKLKDEIANNDKSISDIKSQLTKNDVCKDKKYLREINSLEKENNELRTDLEKYIHFGTGNWHIFKNEFSKDLQPLAQDLAELKSKVYQ